MRFPRPARTIKPTQFYQEFLPAAWATLSAELPRLDWDVCMRVQVTDGPDAGEFALQLTGNELLAQSPASGEPLVTVTCDYEAWRLWVVDLLPLCLDRLEKGWAAWQPALERHLQGPHAWRPEPFEAQPGRVDILYTDDAGDVSRFELQIACGDGPVATVHANDADYRLLLSPGGRLSGLLKSRATVDGDMGYLLGLTRLLEGGE